MATEYHQPPACSCRGQFTLHRRLERPHDCQQQRGSRCWPVRNIAAGFGFERLWVGCWSVNVNLDIIPATVLFSLVLLKLLRAVCSRSLQCDALCSDVLVHPTKSLASFHLLDAEWRNLRFPTDIAVVHISAPVTTPHLSSTSDDDRPDLDNAEQHRVSSAVYATRQSCYRRNPVKPITASPIAPITTAANAVLISAAYIIH